MAVKPAEARAWSLTTRERDGPVGSQSLLVRGCNAAAVLVGSRSPTDAPRWPASPPTEPRYASLGSTRAHSNRFRRCGSVTWVLAFRVVRFASALSNGFAGVRKSSRRRCLAERVRTLAGLRELRSGMDALCRGASAPAAAAQPAPRLAPRAGRLRAVTLTRLAGSGVGPAYESNESRTGKLRKRRNAGPQADRAQAGVGHRESRRGRARRRNGSTSAP